MKIRDQRKLDYVAMASKKRNKNRDYEIIAQIGNDVFMSAVTDLISDIKQSKLYRHEIKRATNELDKEVQSYSRYFNNLLVCPDYFAELASIMEDEIRNDMQLLKIAIKQALDDRKTQEVDLYTSLEFAVCMGCMAYVTTTDIADRYCYTVEQISPKAVIKALSRLLEVFKSRYGQGVDLRVDNNITNFIQQLAYKLCDSKIYASAMDEVEK